MIKIFFSVVSNSSIDFEENKPPGISGWAVSKCRLVAILTADPQTLFTTGIKLACAYADTFKYSVIPPNPQTSG